MSGFEPDSLIDDRYVIIEIVGEGGMGNVLKAREIGLERIVAIKIIQSLSLGDPEARTRFQREAKVLSDLAHTGIVSFYRFGIWQNTPYIVMEYIEGRTLRSLISDNVLTGDHVLSIGLQICEAMESAHALKIIHRDLKPDNVIVSFDSEVPIVKLVDFGLARFLEAAGEKLTATGLLVGSTAYISPEQCSGGKADHRSDIYSVGCILFEMISGRAPFDADTPVALIYKHANAPPPPLVARSTVTHIPPEIEVTLAKALQKSPANRFQSMKEFADAIRTPGQMTEPPAALARDQRPRLVNGVPFTIFLTAVLLLIVGSTSFDLFQDAPDILSPLHGPKIDRASRQAPEGLLKRAGELVYQPCAPAARKVLLQEAAILIDAFIDREKKRKPPDGQLSQAYAMKVHLKLLQVGNHATAAEYEQMRLNCQQSIKYGSLENKKLKPAIMGLKQLAMIETAQMNYRKAEEDWREIGRICKDPSTAPASLKQVPGPYVPTWTDRDTGYTADAQAEALASHRGDAAASTRLRTIIDRWLANVKWVNVEMMAAVTSLANAYKHEGKLKERREYLQELSHYMDNQSLHRDRVETDVIRALADLNIADGELDTALDQLKRAVSNYSDSFRSQQTSTALIKSLKRLQFAIGPDSPTKLAEASTLLNKVQSMAKE